MRARGKNGVMVVERAGRHAGRRAIRCKTGDVITHVNGEEIHDPDELMLNVGKLPPDASVRLTVERDGRSHVVTIDELAKFWVARQENRDQAAAGLARHSRGLCHGLGAISRSGWRSAASTRKAPCWITEVEENSPAWKEGLRPDMMISHVGNKRVATPKEFQEAVANQAGPVKIRLTVPANDRPVRTIEPDAELGSRRPPPVAAQSPGWRLPISARRLAAGAQLPGHLPGRTHFPGRVWRQMTIMTGLAASGTGHPANDRGSRLVRSRGTLACCRRPISWPRLRSL